MTPSDPTDRVRAYLRALHDQLTLELTVEDGAGAFREDAWERPGGGGGVTRVLSDGGVFERVGVGFSHVIGGSLPATATAARPELAGAAFEAMGVSVVAHPRNPYVPTAHLNVRFFTAARPGVAPVWWFGGGFDLTPCYPFEEDVRHWHRIAREACRPFGDDVYPRLKRACDAYFFLPHRNEARGVGGVFFDDLREGGFERCFELTRRVADHFPPAYFVIVRRRRAIPWGAREREFQMWRRGRYAEFNLTRDRGTLFGLQTGGRIEAVLMSLPPAVSWRYDWTPEPGSPEARLEEFLKPRDWA